MANLVELSNQLEDFPEQQLVQMSQDPNSMYPSYLVLSEIQRRNQMRKMYEAQQPKPQTTVAEEVIGEFTGQQGLQGAMAQSPGPQDAFPPSDMGNMAPPSPMQAMASGGRTGYQVGGFTPTAENPYPTGSELVSDTFNNPKEGFLNSLKERYVNPDGTFNTAQITKDGLSTALVASYFTPAGAIRGGLGLLGRGVMSLSKPFTAAGREGIKKSVGRQAAKINPKMVRDPKTGQFRSQAEIGGTAISSVAKPLGLSAGVGILQSPNEEINPEIETAEERAARLAAEEANAKREAREADIAAREQVARDKEAELLAKAKESRQADMLVGLGGAIMSAKNVGELGTGISDAYFGVQSKKDAKDLAGLQGRLLEAQAAKYEADVSNMPLEAILRSLATAEKQLKSLQDAGDVNSASELILYINALNEKAAELQDIKITGSDFLEQYKAS